MPRIEANANDSDSFDDEYQSVDSNDTEGNWQENWLFKKRKLKNETATAIGMLVPSPMEEVKALIGDKTTDEVSDLSEAGSDLDDDDEKGPVNGRRSADLPHALIESKTIIGGKNEVGSFEAKTVDELLQPDSLVSMQSINNFSPIISEAKNDLILMSEHNSRAVLQLNEKVALDNNNEVSGDNDFNEDPIQQEQPSPGDITESTVPIISEIQKPQDNIVEIVEPPIPTPR